MSLTQKKVRFIMAVIAKELVVNNRKKVELFAELERQGYDKFETEAAEGKKKKKQKKAQPATPKKNEKKGSGKGKEKEKTQGKRGVQLATPPPLPHRAASPVVSVPPPDLSTHQLTTLPETSQPAAAAASGSASKGQQDDDDDDEPMMDRWRLLPQASRRF